MATQYAPRLMTAEEVLLIDFGEDKVELDRGVVRMMAGGTARHARIAGNIFRALGNRLQGSGCSPYNADMAVRTRDHCVRYPDVSVFCGHDGSDDDDKPAFPDPLVVVELLSAGTARTDLSEKVPEYKALASLDTILLVDIATERVRMIQRTGPKGWADDEHDDQFDVPLPALGITLPHAEMFAR